MVDPSQEVQENYNFLLQLQEELLKELRHGEEPYKRRFGNHVIRMLLEFIWAYIPEALILKIELDFTNV